MKTRRTPGLSAALTLPILTLTAFTGLALAAQPAVHADTFTFDDVSANGSGTLISNPYHGYTWNNFYIANGAQAATLNGGPGYANGVVSGSNIAYNGFGDTASILQSSTTFTLNSGYFTGAFGNDTITVTGLDALGNAIAGDSLTFTVGDTGPTLETFNFSGISQVSFTPIPQGPGHQFVLDNLTVNAAAATPEPASYAAFAMGGLGLLGLTLKARKRNA